MLGQIELSTVYLAFDGPGATTAASSFPTNTTGPAIPTPAIPTGHLSMTQTSVPTSTTLSTSPPTSHGSEQGGSNESNQISLGVGIAVGVPATIAALWTCMIAMRRHHRR